MKNNPSWMNEELALFRKTVRRFLQEKFVPRHSEWRKQHHPDSEAWTEAGATGLLLTDIPEEYGGGGGSFACEVILVEELAEVGINFAHINQSIVAHYILSYGTEDQKRNWLSRMATGELVGAIAMTEPAAGSDLQAIKTSARRSGDDYIINGSKTFVTNGWGASIVGLAVKTDVNLSAGRGISMIFFEPRGLSGFKVGPPLEKIGMHEQDTCEFFFDDVRVPASCLLGGAEGKGFTQMMGQLPYERMLIAISALATTERAIAITTRYVQERTAFGAPLIDLQNTRFKLAECKTEAHIGRVFIDKCIEDFIAGRVDPTDAAMAKYWMTEKESAILDQCLQLHGGYGYMSEYAIARMWTDSRVHRIYAGSNEIMKEVIGSSL